MVIDRDDDGDENVHFMNLVDEADLFALLDEDAQAAYQEEHRTPVVTEPQQTEPEKETTPVDPEPEKPAKKSNWAPPDASGNLRYRRHRLCRIQLYE